MSEAIPMLQYFLITLGIFLALTFIMAIGVIFSNIKILGSCGGLGKLFGKCDSCETCPKKDEIVKGLEELNDEVEEIDNRYDYDQVSNTKK